MEDSLDIIIPAAGLGSRMKTQGPKSCMLLGKYNLLNMQLDILQNIYPKANIIVVVGFEKEKVQEFLQQWRKFRVVGNKDVKLVWNSSFKETNVAYSIGLANKYTKSKKVLIVYGDLFFNEETFSKIDLLNENQSGLLLDEKDSMDIDEVGIEETNDYVKQLAYKNSKKWAQIALLTKEDADEFARLAMIKRNTRMFSFEIFNKMIESGRSFKIYHNHEMKVVDIDDREDLDKARKVAEFERVKKCV